MGKIDEISALKYDKKLDSEQTQNIKYKGNYLSFQNLKLSLIPFQTGGNQQYQYQRTYELVNKHCQSCSDSYANKLLVTKHFKKLFF